MSGTAAVAAPWAGSRRCGTRPNWVLPGASLDLAFSDGRGYAGGGLLNAGDLLTTTRASNAYADNAAGVWSLFSSNVPRITDKGLLVGESRTNSIRNNSMQGASAPSTYPTNWAMFAGSGLSASVVGVGAENGIDYIDIRVNGVAGGVQTAGLLFFDTITAIAASTGQVYAQSMFVSLVGGDFSNITAAVSNLYEYDSGSVFLRNKTSAFTPTATLSRYNVAYAALGASTAFVRPGIYCATAGAGAVDFTLRIGWPQLELGSFATSPIRTTSAAATRAADVITTARAGTASGTIIIQGRTAPGVSSSNQALWQWDDGTSNNRLVLYRDNTGDLIYEVTAGGVTQAYFDLGAVANDTAFNVAASWATDAFDVALNGTAASSDTSGTVPTGLTTIRHGSDTSGSQWGGLILRESILPVASTAAQLEALSA